MTYNTPIYGCLYDTDLLFLQNWAGPILDQMHLVESYDDLADCTKSIILMHDIDANFHFELTKKLINAGNYFIFLNLQDIKVPSVWDDLTNDLPLCAKFPLINCTTLNEPGHLLLGVETYFFKVYHYLNVKHAKDILSQYAMNRPYHFLYMNLHHRPHRSALWNTLEKKGLLDNCLKSYIGVTATGQAQSHRVHLPAQYESKYVCVDTTSERWRNAMRNLYSWKIDGQQNQPIECYLDPTNKFTDTYFSIVTETLVDPTLPLFMSEKIFKPLIAGHPFIVLGQPGLYRYLHSLGFKTFGHVIDESFDHEVDLEKRIDMIAEEVRKICSSDLNEFARACQDVCVHNHQHYVTSVHDRFAHIGNNISRFIEQHIDRAQYYFQTGILT